MDTNIEVDSTFKYCPLKKGNGHRLMVDHSSSKRCVSIRFRLAVYNNSKCIAHTSKTYRINVLK